MIKDHVIHSYETFVTDVDYLQIATVEVPKEHMGPVVELLGKRRGLMFDMEGVGWVKFTFCFRIMLLELMVPTDGIDRSLIVT